MVAVCLERAHAQFLGQGEGLAISHTASTDVRTAVIGWTAWAVNVQRKCDVQD